jgi:murein DD-endopeptidase MepM/ murein hydrolase activator NlpD
VKYLFVLLFLVCLQAGTAQSMKRHIKITKDSVYVNLINPFEAPLEISMQPLDSSAQYIRVKNHSVLRYNDTLKNALIVPVRRVKVTINFRVGAFVKFNATFGDPNDQPDGSLYVLPYPVGKRYKIIQGFGGKFSHNLKSSFHAIDFGTQIGDTITAARSGKVFFVKEDSNEHCRTRDCADKGNKILVIHTDGTIANYVHLDFNGALVDVGDLVTAGQPIGISGMTGFTTTPHLHFVVHKAGSETVPVYFKGIGQKSLKQGRYYQRKQ